MLPHSVGRDFLQVERLEPQSGQGGIDWFLTGIVVGGPKLQCLRADEVSGGYPATEVAVADFDAAIWKELGVKPIVSHWRTSR